MANDASLGIVATQLLQQCVESVLLQLGAGVGGNTALIKTAFVTYCYRAVVVAYGVDAPYTLRENRDNVAVAAHIIVITIMKNF